MQLVSLVSILLASAGSALGSPAPIVETRSLETVLYKRGDVLDKRGYELAALHGVDTNESKHFLPHGIPVASHF